jgi:hypothetical protein
MTCCLDCGICGGAAMAQVLDLRAPGLSIVGIGARVDSLEHSKVLLLGAKSLHGQGEIACLMNARHIDKFR